MIDTNILVSSLSSRSASHWLLEALQSSMFDLVVTTEILLEYEEVLSRKYSSAVADAFLAGLQELPNVVLTTVYYRWHLLSDPDDNKFVEASLAADADCIVTEDAHFRLLARIDFPKIQVLPMAQLREILFV